MQTIYLAGPGVFRPDAAAWGQALQAACAEQGLCGLYPLDQACPADLHGPTAAAWIFQQNCALIQQADAVLADVRAFRSQSEPDSGTAFEIGYAHALGKPIYLWLPDLPAGVDMQTRLAGVTDAQGWHIENFAAPLNLMLWQAATAVIYATDPQSAVEILAERCAYQR
ncbi:nucleoside 2-deoxyribosyltransferase [Chitinibacter sp. ZOR0017]|uniref:nucleoside 2-deoxyribosyltransferase n=1 Tax=Chitinibacter sp. ZOR0017 TaxID=1339254 RepID=UPI00064819BA|nr:nucleoside 2-deoxyribosyltransferase [Chitinibacter sp. ZOR0017]